MTRTFRFGVSLVLSGSTTAIADRLQRLRADHGTSYVSVQAAHAESFAKVIAALG